MKNIISLEKWSPTSISVTTSDPQAFSSAPPKNQVHGKSWIVLQIKGTIFLIIRPHPELLLVLGPLEW